MIGLYVEKFVISKLDRKYSLHRTVTWLPRQRPECKTKCKQKLTENCFVDEVTKLKQRALHKKPGYFLHSSVDIVFYIFFCHCPNDEIVLSTASVTV